MMLALLVTLLSSLSWAGFDIARKILVRRVDVLVVAAVVNLAQLPGFVAWGVVHGGFCVAAPYWLPASASIALNLAANVMFLYAVLRSELSATIPLLGLTPVLALGFGAIVLGEEPSLTQGVGIVVIVLGALGLTAKPKDFRRPWRLLLAPLFAAGGPLMIGVALCWALAPFFDKLALQHAAEGAHGAILSGGVGSALILALALTRRVDRLGDVASAKLPFLVGGLFALIAMAAQLVAVQLMLVSLFEGLKRAIGMSASVLAGRVFFGEAMTPQKLVSAAVMTLGVLLMV